MIIVTGGAGFIGSVILKGLNDRGRNDILVVDSAENAMSPNLQGKHYLRFIDKEVFLSMLDGELPADEVETVIHMGACTSTTERDVAYLTKNNVEYSQRLATWCFDHNKQFIYASSAATYGNGALGFSDANESAEEYKPLNPYGESKKQFDIWLISNGFDKNCTGFKFFNVFGPNEYHKGDMASLVFKAYNQIKTDGALRLFKSYDPRYEDGEFVRDFIYVKDSLDVILWAFDHKEVTGIYNLGTGRARSWNDLAKALFSALNKPVNIKYIDMPESIRDAYQYFTEADMTKLEHAGYKKPFTSLEASVKDYVDAYLTKPNPYY